MPILQRQFKTDFRPFISGEKPTFATVLLGGCLRTYGIDCLNWDGITLEMELKRDFETEVPRVVYDQIQGLITVLTTDLVYHNVPVFDQVVNALNRSGVAEDQDPPTAEELAWAVAEILLNDPEPVMHNEDTTFDDDIQGYCRVVLDQEGIMTPPKSLSWVKKSEHHSEFNNDPELYAAAWQNQMSDGQAVDKYVEKCLEKVFEDMQLLGLKVRQDKG